MEILETIKSEIWSFLSFGALWEIVQTGDYSKFATLEGIQALMYPIMPLLMLIEIGRAAIYKRWNLTEFRIPFIIYVLHRVVGRFISIAAIGFCIGLLAGRVPLQLPFEWYWVPYGYIVWELGHFIYHFLGHKVRLFWCLHSTHHTPESMNLTVSYAHFFLEAPYADVIRTTVCLLLGVSPPLLFFIMFVDGFWGTFIHIGEGVLPNGRLGFLENWLLTPSHHRVHHARNPLYMDTNFCNLLNIWDKVFKTYQLENQAIPVEYGVTRPMDCQNFWDVYFGEFALLARDVWQAPGLKNKFLYLFMPPGWTHFGEGKTARRLRRDFLEKSG